MSIPAASKPDGSRQFKHGYGAVTGAAFRSFLAQPVPEVTVIVMADSASVQKSRHAAHEAEVEIEFRPTCVPEVNPRWAAAGVGEARCEPAAGQGEGCTEEELGACTGDTEGVAGDRAGVPLGAGVPAPPRWLPTAETPESGPIHAN